MTDDSDPQILMHMILATYSNRALRELKILILHSLNRSSTYCTLEMHSGNILVPSPHSLNPNSSHEAITNPSTRDMFAIQRASQSLSSNQSYSQ